MSSFSSSSSSLSTSSTSTSSLARGQATEQKIRNILSSILFDETESAQTVTTSALPSASFSSAAFSLSSSPSSSSTLTPLPLSVATSLLDPFSFAAFRDRLITFTSHRWTYKPTPLLSPLHLAYIGFTCPSSSFSFSSLSSLSTSSSSSSATSHPIDTLICSLCHSTYTLSFPSILNEVGIQFAAKQYYKQLKQIHKQICPFNDNYNMNHNTKKSNSNQNQIEEKEETKEEESKEVQQKKEKEKNKDTEEEKEAERKWGRIEKDQIQRRKGIEKRYENLTSITSTWINRVNLSDKFKQQWISMLDDFDLKSPFRSSSNSGNQVQTNVEPIQMNEACSNIALISATLGWDRASSRRIDLEEDVTIDLKASKLEERKEELFESASLDLALKHFTLECSICCEQIDIPLDETAKEQHQELEFDIESARSNKKQRLDPSPLSSSPSPSSAATLTPFDPLRSHRWFCPYSFFFARLQRGQAFYAAVSLESALNAQLTGELKKWIRSRLQMTGTVQQPQKEQESHRELIVSAYKSSLSNVRKVILLQDL